ncbi:hypothetical protein LAWI1_G001232 [Lachnellula willkommii]|uniref:Fungal N-terminal domain-containing protein n=1 Tax=Lachnellula willkommii TaxID=215461 RepID=A0A559MMD4_9HELO|nr:hypothetical protein LAWI1_G001232 [Lachnellula willkommii]
MSFGVSIGDGILLMQLAWNTLQGARQACGEYDELTQEVASLHKVLQRVQREMAKARPSFDAEHRKELYGHLEGCAGVLRVLNRILEKYNSLGESDRKGKGLWKKVQFGNGEMRNLDYIRNQLLTHTVAINISLNLCIWGQLGDIGSQMDSQGGDIREIKSKVAWVVAEMMANAKAEGNGSTWTVYEEDDMEFWRELRRKLHKEGYPESDLAERKELIMGYVKELGHKGALDDILDEEEDLSGVGDIQAQASDSVVESVDDAEDTNVSADEKEDRSPSPLVAANLQAHRSNPPKPMTVRLVQPSEAAHLPAGVPFLRRRSTFYQSQPVQTSTTHTPELITSSSVRYQPPRIPLRVRKLPTAPDLGWMKPTRPPYKSTLTPGYLNHATSEESSSKKLSRTESQPTRGAVINEPRWIFPDEDILPAPRTFVGGCKKYRVGTKSSVPLDLADFH